METERDLLFMQILRQEKNLTNLVDGFFGFLYRCTYFYHESDCDEKHVFQPGEAEKLIVQNFQKWQNIHFLSKMDKPSKAVSDQSALDEQVDSPHAIVAQEIEVKTENQSIEPEPRSCNQDNEYAVPLQSSDCYNGAIRDNYTWSQSINDLDVIVEIPTSLKTVKDLRLNLDSKLLKVEVRTCLISNHTDTNCAPKNLEWTTLFEGELSFKTRKDESVWSLVPGQYVSIHLEKASERWWEALVVGEPKIELNKIDCTRQLEDMGQDEQMKIQELMWNQQQKMLRKPTADQIKMEKILKQAWDAKGSPFKGTPYDPSILKFN